MQVDERKKKRSQMNVKLFVTLDKNKWSMRYRIDHDPVRSTLIYEDDIIIVIIILYNIQPIGISKRISGVK